MNNENNLNHKQEDFINLEEIVGELMKIKGNVRGEVLYSNFVCIFEKKGQEGLGKVEKRLVELGCPLKMKTIKRLRWYPEAQSVLLIAVAKEVFGWVDEDIFEMGNFAPKYSFIVRVMMKYLVSLEKVLEQSLVFWKKHFDFAELEIGELNELEKYTKIRVKGYKFLPMMCHYHAGYFLRIAQLCVKSKEIKIKETKCVFSGEPYNEYLISWF